MSRFREHIAESGRALRAVFANPNLRRVELALIGSETGKWFYIVALAVFAYDHGGATAVGIVAAIRYWPSFAAAPFLSILGDRFPRKRVMVGATLLRALGMGFAALTVLLGGPPALVYALAASVSVISTAFRPAQAALLPSLVRAPAELTAANVASSTITSLGVVTAPALGGVLLVVTSTQLVFAVTGAIFLCSALVVSRIQAPGDRPKSSTEGREGFGTQLLGGFRAIARTGSLRVLVLLYAAQTLVAGAMNVLLVVAALEVLDLGKSGVGFLNAALGVGGVVGALAALALVGSQRLASNFAFGLVLWGAPLAVIGVWPQPVLVFVLLAFIGVGDTLVDVSGVTLLQRAAPNEVLARVFGALQSLTLGGFGLGALAAPALIALVGVRGALICVGALLPALATLFWRRLQRIDEASLAPSGELKLLRGVSIFTPLPPETAESLASVLTVVDARAGEAIFTQGDHGDRFYIVAGGEVEVTIDGRPARELGIGESFGEIALLHDVPRTATVRAKTDTRLYALDRADFIAAVTGHAPSADAANAVIATRLASFRPSMASD